MENIMFIQFDCLWVLIVIKKLLVTKILYKSNKMTHPWYRFGDRPFQRKSSTRWTLSVITNTILNTVSALNACSSYFTQRQSLPQSTNWSILCCTNALNRTIWSPATGDTVYHLFLHVLELLGVASFHRCRRTCCKHSIPTTRSLCNPLGVLKSNMLKMTSNGNVSLFLTVFPKVLSRFSEFLRTLLLWMVAICVDYAVHDGFRVAAGDYAWDRGLRYWNCVVLSVNKSTLTFDDDPTNQTRKSCLMQL